jgi:hypothetical protein
MPRYYEHHLAPHLELFHGMLLLPPSHALPPLSSSSALLQESAADIAAAIPIQPSILLTPEAPSHTILAICILFAAGWGDGKAELVHNSMQQHLGCSAS